MTAYKLSTKAQEFLSSKKHKLYINNNWTEGGSEESIDIINPATEKKISSITNASAEDVSNAVAAARQAFQGKDWKRMPPMKREKLLYAVADRLEAEVEVLAEILTLENGKLYSHAKSEIKGAANTFRYYAGWATKIEGQTIDISLRQAPGKQNFAFVKREAIGVVPQSSHGISLSLLQHGSWHLS